MDAALLVLTLAGALAGFAASAVPGLHVNALAVVVLALAPAAGPGGAAFLVAALAASPFGLALSSTWLGAASEDAAMQAPPAQAMAQEGRGLEAVAWMSWGAWTGVALALPLSFLLRGLLVPAAPWLARAMPWLLLGLAAALVLSEPRRLPARRAWRLVPWRGGGTRTFTGPLRRAPRLRVGRRLVVDPHGILDRAQEGDVPTVSAEPAWVGRSRWAGRAAALGVLLLSGALGFAAFRLGASSPLGLPASPLLPLLAGLFALPGLLRAILRPARAPPARLHAPRPPRWAVVKGAAPGVLASSLLGLAPGVSASHVALALPPARAPERTLARLAAINGGAVVFTLLAWHALGKARSGALVAAEAMAPPHAWPTWAPTPAILHEAALVLGAATLALLLARAASRPLAHAVSAGWGRALSLAGLATLLLSVALFNGGLGLAELAVAGLVGEANARLGVRRGLSMGVILVPALLRAWGLA